MAPPPPIPLADAQQLLLARAGTLGAERVTLDRCSGRYLAAPATARRTQPAADLSAMDGYAVRDDDLAGPWRIVGESAAGHPFDRPLCPGEAARISTGALMPGNAGAILLQENAKRDNSDLAIAEGAPERRHVRRAGFDFLAGDAMLPTGALLTPARIALLLSGGHGEALVGKRPSVTIIDSGDELAPDPEDCPAHRIPASNGAMLAGMAMPLARAVDRIGPVADRIEDLLSAFEQASASDVVVTSGGASVGDHDLIRPALERWGAEIDFWRVAMRPGKPLLVARRGRQVILGLPGNPVSSFVTAFLFLLPLLRHQSGAADPLPFSLRLPLAAPLPSTGRRAEFVRAALRAEGVLPLDQQDSSALLALSRTDCLIIRPAMAPASATGEFVEVHPVDGRNA